MFEYNATMVRVIDGDTMLTMLTAEERERWREQMDDAKAGR